MDSVVSLLFIIVVAFGAAIVLYAGCSLSSDISRAEELESRDSSD